MTFRAISFTAAIAASLVASSAVAKTYDCQLNPPKALSQDGKKVGLSEISFPALKSETWRLQIQIVKGRGDEPDMAKVLWPTNPIQIAGEFPVLPTAKGAIAFVSVGSGPCMFTTQGCFSTVQIAEQGAGKAKILVTPTALWTDDTTNQSDPFVALIDGTCTWKDSE